MAKPLVAVVGKPNVGKSTFFNKVSGNRTSIVLDTPGVTRDRIYADAEWCGHSFTLVDTGGIQVKSGGSMEAHIKKQSELAIELADIVLFFLDGKHGLTSEDLDIADILRKCKKPVILVVNKIDNFGEEDLTDFYSLGIGDLFAISAEHMKGIGDLLDEVVKNFPYEEATEDNCIKIAIVGKPNAGKSSILNKLLGYDRTIVSDISGTTRDAIDANITINGVDYTLIDTAGIRRQRSIDDGTVEQYSVMRSLAAIRRADVCLVVFDAEEGLSEQAVRIAGYVHEQGKPSVIAINKWDIIEKDTFTIEKFNKMLKTDLSFMDYFVSITISALTGQRINKLIDLINGVYANSAMRISTGVLNDVISDALTCVEPPTHNGRRLKIKYTTQVAVQPPTFVIFVNDSKLMHFSYKRYLENSLRKAFDFSGTPIRIIVRDKSEEENEITK